MGQGQELGVFWEIGCEVHHTYAAQIGAGLG